jgi:hypothetical protein
VKKEVYENGTLAYTLVGLNLFGLNVGIQWLIVLGVVLIVLGITPLRAVRRKVHRGRRK